LALLQNRKEWRADNELNLDGISRFFCHPLKQAQARANTIQTTISRTSLRSTIPALQSNQLFGDRLEYKQNLF